MGALARGKGARPLCGCRLVQLYGRGGEMTFVLASDLLAREHART